MKKILLVEPGYRNKYPPLGLMKISSYHKRRGDYVCFVKGCSQSIANEGWDRIYVATLFVFEWNATIKAIEFYLPHAPTPQDVIVGGVLATLMSNEVQKKTGVRVIQGLINKPGMLDTGDKTIVDHLIPDYSILKDTNYQYSLDDAYLGYATRGCPKHCAFCAVNSIEPDYVHYMPLTQQVKAIEDVYGAKQDLILMDNNILASSDFERIISDIINLGFEKGASRNRRQRKVDFNQGTDATLFDQTKAKLIAKIAIKPLRIAFDFIGLKDTYTHAIELVAEQGILDLSNYVLFNYTDTPQDFYKRLRINVELNKRLGTQIYSFPMKFLPLKRKDRKYVGPHWHRQWIRGVQNILLATHGMVSPKLDFFVAAFGADENEFLKIVMMPERYIVFRRKHESDGAMDWVRCYNILTKTEMDEFLNLCSDRPLREDDLKFTSSSRLREFMSHYIEI